MEVGSSYGSCILLNISSWQVISVSGSANLWLGENVYHTFIGEFLS